MIYGTPADRNLVRLLRWIDEFPSFRCPADGLTPQQPVHVDDLTRAILASLDRPAGARREYDVGGPEAITLRELIEACARALGRPVVDPADSARSRPWAWCVRRGGWVFHPRQRPSRSCDSRSRRRSTSVRRGGTSTSSREHLTTVSREEVRLLRRPSDAIIVITSTPDRVSEQHAGGPDGAWAREAAVDEAAFSIRNALPFLCLTLDDRLPSIAPVCAHLVTRRARSARSPSMPVATAVARQVGSDRRRPGYAALVTGHDRRRAPRGSRRLSGAMAASPSPTSRTARRLPGRPASDPVISRPPGWTPWA